MPNHSAYRSSVPRPRRRRGCSIRLFPLLALFFSLIVSGYVFWLWTGTLPRSNILILGLDRRPGEGDVVRSDTIILMTVYPRGERIGLLSIPRDLYVDIPGYGENRINTAHFWGEAEARGGGPTLAMQTVTQNFGLPVHHYVRVDFEAFRAIVDAVGGVDIVVEEPIVDDAYPTEDYGVMRIEIPAGPQRMDGETALRYVRSRHGASDFERAARQQQVLNALARRLLKPGAWLRWPLVYDALLRYVDTDMSSKDMLLILPTLYRVGPDGIEHRAIDREMTQPWTSPEGGAVLLPQWEVINPVIWELFMP